jgi:predicted amidophosphoribosyltransferase
MSLLRPHPMLSSAGHSYDTNKMVVQLRMLSGRYRVGSLLRHFSPSISGCCELCGLELEDIEHLLVPRCPALEERRRLLLDYMSSVLSKSETCSSILETMKARNQTQWVQFVLDCSAIPEVVKAAQQDDLVYPLIYKATRTWCYSLHRTRLKLLGRW